MDAYKLLSDFVECRKDECILFFNDNIALQYCLAGWPITFFEKDGPNIRKILFKDLLLIFAWLLDNGCHEIIEYIWKNNVELLDYFCWRAINVGHSDFIEEQKITISEAVMFLELLLQNHCYNILNDIWFSSSMIRYYLAGDGSSFLGFQDSMNIYNLAMENEGFSYIGFEMQNSNVLLKNYLNSSIYNNEIYTIFFNNLKIEVEKFLSLIAKRNPKVTKKAWEKNLVIQSYFYGKYISFDDNNFFSFKNFLASIRNLLSCRCAEVINIVFSKNTWLKEYFAGKSIDIIVIGRQRWKTVQIDLYALEEFFNAALSSHKETIINSIWDYNSQFRSFFSGHNISQAKLEINIRSVLSSSHTGASGFIRKFLSCVTDLNALVSVLNCIKGEISKNTISDYKQNQIFCLNRRIRALDGPNTNSLKKEKNAERVNLISSVKNQTFFQSRANDSAKRGICEQNSLTVETRNTKKQCVSHV